jgi:hypothetical protein
MARRWNYGKVKFTIDLPGEGSLNGAVDQIQPQLPL